MRGQRVLITGVGGELGWRVTRLVEQLSGVESILALDVEPPRGRLELARFERINLAERDTIVAMIRAFEPTSVIHLSVWEPHARTNPKLAAERTLDSAMTVFGAIAECESVTSIVHRSGIEVYGRGRAALTRPNESAPLHPTSPFGETLVELEHFASDVGESMGVPVTALRLASVLGPHVPSPLGRLLRLAAVPFGAATDPAFAVIHQADAADAFVAALTSRHDGPVNIVASGAITTVQAIRCGRRIPVPVIGPQWALARRAAYLGGAPIPPHIEELLKQGRLADNTLATEALGFNPSRSTVEVVRELYSWPSIIRVPAERQVA